jgi:hypothetical protein
MTLWQRLVRVGKSDMTVLTWMLGWIALALSFGFFVSGTDTGNYGLLNSTLSKEIWGVFFLIYGVLLLISCLYYIHKWLSRSNAILGVWLWTYLFSSFAIFDQSPIASTEWMLTLPIVAQLWIFFNSCFKVQKPCIQRVDNDELQLVDLIRKIRHEIKSLNNDLFELHIENSSLKQEVNTLTSEVTKIKSSMCFVPYCKNRDKNGNTQ